MKATLTIEVPNDFEKGQCEKCQFGFDEDIMFETEYECSIIGYEAKNCPLEIKENTDEID